MQTPNFSLNHDGFGKLVMVLTDDAVHEGMVPARAFPISAADEGSSLMSTDGHELAQIAQSDALPAPMHVLIEAGLGAREFMPEIRTIVGVSTYATPSAWTMQTDHDQTDLVLRNEEDIRHLTGTTLLISDSRDVHYLIHDLLALDKHSCKILDRFL